LFLELPRTPLGQQDPPEADYFAGTCLPEYSLMNRRIVTDHFVVISAGLGRLDWIADIRLFVLAGR